MIGRRVRFMAKRELFDHRVSGPIMRACRHIEVDRADGAGRSQAPEVPLTIYRCSNLYLCRFVDI